jgi:NitT/TauT family transport system substrate-binding protein
MRALSMLLLSVLVLCGPGSLGAGAQTAELIRFGASPFEAQGTVYYAQELGLFKRAGLNVEVQQFPGGAAILAGIAGGSLQVGFGNPLPLANARERGLKFVFIAPGYLYDWADPEAGTMLIVAAAGPIREAKDLNGKTLAGTSLRSIDTIAAYSWMDAHGGTSSTVKFVELPQAAMGEAVASGRIDGAVVSQPSLGASLATGRTRGLVRPYDALGRRVMVSGVFTTEEWADKHPDEARRIRAAINEAAVWAVKNPEAAAEVLQRNLKIATQRAHEYHARTLDPSFIQPVLDGALRYKFMTQKMDARELIWKG